MALIKNALNNRFINLIQRLQFNKITNSCSQYKFGIFKQKIEIILFNFNQRKNYNSKQTLFVFMNENKNKKFYTF